MKINLKMSKVKLTPEEEKAKRQGYLLKEMSETRGWKEVILPWLESQLKNAWLDPREFDSDEKLRYAYSIAWARADAANAVREFVEKMISQAEYLTRKERGEVQENKFEKYWREK